MTRLHLFLVPCSLFLAPAAFAQKNATVPDPDPEVERKSFQVADGFEVNLFAADPLLAKPIQMNFGPDGRLWVACSETYPQIKPGEKANDKVLVLEDADGDGRADKTTVFADGLLIPTGVEPGDGGAYVADSTDVVHFADPDPKTGKATKKRIVLSGFGTEDTHHILHTFRWGPGGALHMNQSIYIHSHVETPHGVRRLNAGGIWQYRPETGRLEVFARGFINPWGTAWDRWGGTFATDGAHFFGITPIVPGAYYPTAQGSARILEGLNPGSPKHCGLEVLSGRHLPDEYRGRLVTNDFRGHRVCVFELSDDGSAYSSKERPELIKTSHPAFRPIDVKMGPDGAVYVADWYNPIIQHGEVDFRDPRRDKTHGRIWRITAKGRPLVERPKLVGATVPDLLAQLKSPEDWTRAQARRLLQERGAKDVLPELGRWAAKLDAADDHGRLEALWVYQALDTPEPKLLESLLTAKDFRARAAAGRVAGQWAGRLPDVLALLSPRAADDHPRVRLEAVRALAEIATAAAALAASAALDKPLDKWLDYAVWLTLRDLAPVWQPELAAGRLDFGGDPKKIAFALRAAGTGDAATPLARLLRDGKLSPERELEVMLDLARVGGPAELGLVIVRAGKLPADAAGKVMTAVEEAARVRKVGLPSDAEAVARISQLLDQGTGDSRRAAARLVGAWKLDGLRPRLDILAAGDADDRAAAFDAHARLGGEASKKALLAAAGTGDAVARRQAVVALTDLDTAAAAPAAAALLASNPPAEETVAVVAAFAGRKDGAKPLAVALTGKTLPADTAKVGVRAAKAAAQPSEALVAAITKAGGLGDARKPLTPAEVSALLADVADKGDPARGELVFRRADLACLKCHAIAGAGGQVGPELTSIGASAQPDYLLDSLLHPNKQIKEGYHSVVVNTLDGKAVTGVKIRETPKLLVLRDAEDRELTIPTDDIDSQKAGQSLMPDGLHDPLTRAELVDLVRFLTALGKVGGGFQATPGKSVRRWEVLQPTKEVYTVIGRERLAAVANPGRTDLTWLPAYSRVSGDLPLDDLPTVKFAQTVKPTAVVRFRVEVTTPGPVKLSFADPAGLTVWVDGRPADLSRELVVSLTAGVHTVTVAAERAAAAAALRAELDEVPASPARARVVGGK